MWTSLTTRPHRKDLALDTQDPEPQRVRTRVRKRKRRRGLPRRAWLWLPLLGGLVLLGALAVGLFVRDALVVRDSLTAARASLSDVRSAAGSIDVEEASVALASADEELAGARSRSGGPLWSLAARMPVVGDSVRVTQEVVRVASAGIGLASTAVADGEKLLGQGLDVEIDEGRVDLAPLEEAATVLGELPLERLIDARDRLAQQEFHWAPADVVEGRRATLELANETIDSVERSRHLLDALPTFLGTREPRRYFLGVQTPAELRGTGGLIGYYAVLEVDDGRFELQKSDVYEALDGAEDTDEPRTAQIGTLIGDVTDGVAVDDEFRERYEHTAAAGLFSNVNVDPDLPTTAAVALDLYEKRTGEALDGMILTDPMALETILTTVGGDIELPGAATDTVDVPASLPPERFAEFVTVGIYEEFGHGRGTQRRQLLQDLGDAAFSRVFDGAWDGVAMSRAIGQAAAERHLQVFSRQNGEQAAFRRLGVAGVLQSPGDADLLAVTANNAVGGKQDVHLGHRVAAEVTLDDPRRDDEGRITVDRQADIRVEVYNPLPREGMDTYVIGNCLVGEEGGCFDGPPGENRTWFSVWAPGDSDLVSAQGSDGRAGVQAGRIRGLRVFDRYLETPSEHRSQFHLVYRGRAPADIRDGELVYEMAWWAQAKAIPTMLDVAVTAPDGWRVTDVDVEGGGGGEGLGAFGDGEPLRATVGEDGRAQLTGTVTADTRLRVHLSGDG